VARTARLVLSCALLSAAFVCSAACGDEPVQGAATPEEFVRRYYEARAKADVAQDPMAEYDLLRPYLAAPAREKLRLDREVARAAVAWEGTLDTKFGKDPTYKSLFAPGSPRPKVKNVLFRDKKEDGPGQLLVTVWKTEERDGKEVVIEEILPLVKEPDGWKHLTDFSYPAREEKVRVGPDGKEVKVRVPLGAAAVWKPGAHVFEQDSRHAVAYRKAVERQTDAVRAGQYGTRQEAVEGFMKAMKATGQQNRLVDDAAEFGELCAAIAVQRIVNRGAPPRAPER
jgi:hypothetical protein